MKSKNDRFIVEAQKLALQGKHNKAIKAYKHVVELEPHAFNHRLRLAELLVKTGRTDDARAEFEAIGKKYMSEGFYLKAIAIYRKLQGLFPEDISISLTLASLNAKHGLVANALAEYKLVYDFYQKSSNRDDALKILEIMQVVDPLNINIKLKLADAYYNYGLKEESYDVFNKLATLYQEQGDTVAFEKIDARILRLFPQKANFERLRQEPITQSEAGTNDDLLFSLDKAESEENDWLKTVSEMIDTIAESNLPANMK